MKKEDNQSSSLFEQKRYKAPENSDGVKKNHIAGIIRVVKPSIYVNGNKVINYQHFKLKQSATTHHEFELSLPYDALPERQNQKLEQANEFLGKRLSVIFQYKDFDTKDSPETVFVGVITNVGFSQEGHSLGNIVLKGFSPTILLDSAPHTQSFGGDNLVNTGIIADYVIKQGLDSLYYDFKVNAKANSYIPFSIQYNETHYNYLCRLAEAYGEQFYYDGECLHFGEIPPPNKPVDLVSGSSITNLKVEIKAVHTKPSYYGYNSSSNAKLTSGHTRIKHKSDLANTSYNRNEKIFTTESLQIAPIRATTDMDVVLSQTSASGSKATEVFSVTADTSVPFLYPGCVADIYIRKENSDELSYFTRVMMVEVNHELDARGEYKGSFKAIASDTGYMPKPEFEIPKAEPQFATVISNIDPQGQGRVKVRFDWQNHDTTDFIRVMSPDAGGTGAITQNRGYVAIPEVGDQVMVGFVHNHPDRPFVMGGLFHGGTALGGGIDNHLRSIQTKSGIKILMNDSEDKMSITILDIAGNTIYLDTVKKSITIQAPETIDIICKNLNIKVEENMKTTVGHNQETTVSKNIKTVAKEEISQDSGKKTIIASGDNTEISAKRDLDLYGKKNLIGFTDGKTEFGAKEQMHVYGANSLITAKDKIEYKAPSMNKLPENGTFDYDKEPKILNMLWCYGEDNTPLTDDSRHYVDMNLVVQTRNYEAGESVTITIKAEDGEAIADGLTEISLTGNVDEESQVIFKGPFKNYSLHLMNGDNLEVENEEDENAIYMTHEGKDYTKSEWKDFEQKQWEEYQKRRQQNNQPKKGFWG